MSQCESSINRAALLSYLYISCFFSCLSFSLQNIILHGEMHFYPLTKYENRAFIDKYYLPFVNLIKYFLRKTVTFSVTLSTTDDAGNRIARIKKYKINKTKIFIYILSYFSYLSSVFFVAFFCSFPPKNKVKKYE